MRSVVALSSFGGEGCRHVSLTEREPASDGSEVRGRLSERAAESGVRPVRQAFCSVPLPASALAKKRNAHITSASLWQGVLFFWVFLAA